MSRHVGQYDESLDRLWWLAPGALFCLVIGSTMLAAALQSDSAFQLYGTPKYLELKHVLLAAGAIAAFGIGSRLAAVTGPMLKFTSTSLDRKIRPWFWVSFGLTLFGYAAWL